MLVLIARTFLMERDFIWSTNNIMIYLFFDRHVVSSGTSASFWSSVRCCCERWDGESLLKCDNCYKVDRSFSKFSAVIYFNTIYSKLAFLRNNNSHKIDSFVEASRQAKVALSRLQCLQWSAVYVLRTRWTPWHSHLDIINFNGPFFDSHSFAIDIMPVARHFRIFIHFATEIYEVSSIFGKKVSE